MALGGGGTWGRLARVALRAAVDAAVSRPRHGTRGRTGPTAASRTRGGSATAPGGPTGSPGGRSGSPAPAQAPTPAGDFDGIAHIEYRPAPDGDADPGEIVWGWVPFEEDRTRGKDRPALVVARDGRWVLALMLSSRDHDGPGPDGGRAASHQRWLDIGTGAWDTRRRPSEVRLDRVLRLDPQAIRREGAVLDRHRFDEVAAALRSLHGWT